MSARASSRLFVPADVESMDDPLRFELVDGDLVERHMGSESTETSGRILFLVSRFIWGKRLGKAYGSDMAVHLDPTRPNNFRRPDFSFVRGERLPDGASPRGDLFLAPDLCTEVVSPNDNAGDLNAKVQEYLASGVHVVWVVFPDTRSVEVYRADGSRAVLTGDTPITLDDVLPGVRVPGQ